MKALSCITIMVIEITNFPQITECLMKGKSGTRVKGKSYGC